MKNFLKKIAVLSIVLMSMMTWTTQAQTLNITITASPWQTVSYSICQPQYTQAIVYKPSWAMNGIHFLSDDGYGDFFQDSIIITNANDGLWYMLSSEGTITININFVAAPSEPWTVPSITTCGTLHAQGGSPQPGTTYLWSTGATTESINVTTPGNYAVTVTNSCSSVTDNINVLWSGPNPNLGANDTVCFGTILAPGTFTSYLWTGGSTAATMNVTTTGNYGVTVTNSNGCKATDNVYIQVDTLRAIEICDVTYDTITHKISVNHYVNSSETEITDVVVYKKNQMGIIVPLDTIPYTQESYIDWTSNPQSDYGEYCIKAITHCGEGPASIIHKSIWLTTLTNELQWQNYVGNFTPLYYIVFALMNTGTIVAIDTIPACSGSGCLNHCPITWNPNVVQYFVAFEHTCSSKSNGWVISNFIDATTVGITNHSIDIDVIVYPNPTKDNIRIDINYNEFEVKMYNIFGQVVLTERNKKVLNIEDLPKGIYIISITANGVTTNKKIFKN